MDIDDSRSYSYDNTGLQVHSNKILRVSYQIENFSKNFLFNFILSPINEQLICFYYQFLFVLLSVIV